MDAKTSNTRSSVDSHSPLLTNSSSCRSSLTEKSKDTSRKDAAAPENLKAKDTLNPKHPVSSIPFSMQQW
ncbi:hypothetical protein MY10362_002605 [Beauveria mimosiformis]